MVYKMVMYVDGGCRNNGYDDAFGASACVQVRRSGHEEIFTKRLPGWKSKRPTSQRAELHAIILALRQAIRERSELDFDPFIQLTIYTDSKYSYGCMTNWSRKWRNNGFINSLGYEVVNRDLIEKALDLEEDILDHGTVLWEWIPRSDNVAADEAANDVMDEMADAMEY